METSSYKFLREPNKTHPNLKFTHKPSKEMKLFLDLSVSLCNVKLCTDLQIKANDCHHLYYTSSYPDHTKKSIVYSKALCLSRVYLLGRRS